MPNALKSNLVIATSLQEPTGRGLNTVEKSLSKIQELISDLNNKTVNIKVRLEGEEQALRILTDLSEIQRRLNIAKGRENSGIGRSGTSGVNSGLPPGVARRKKTTSSKGEKIEETTKSVSGGTLREDVEIFENGEKTGTRTTDTNIDQNAKVKEEIRIREEQVRARYKAAKAANQLAASTASLNEKEQELKRQGFRLSSETTTFDEVTKKRGRVATYYKEAADGREIIARLDFAGQKYGRTVRGLTNDERALNEALKEQSRDAKRAADEQARLAQIQQDFIRKTQLSKRFAEDLTQNQDFVLSGVTTNENIETGEIKTIEEYRKVLEDGTEVVKTLNVEQARFRTSIDRSTKAVHNKEKAAQLELNQQDALRHETKLLSEGYQIHGQKVKQVRIGTERFNTTLTELRRTSGSPILGNYEVEIARVNSATGDLETSTLRGSDAIRKMGDSFGSAIRKVSLWFAATTTLFAIGAGIRFVGQQFKELEQNTIFLARVGNSLVRSNDNLGSSFMARYQEAKILTSQLVDLSAALGTSATEAQRAASVFLRAGQNRVEALESTRVALLASKIAELEVEEAAKLLNSAQLQFNLSSQQLLPTLDALNTLSNSYRVTTDDLLQAISRSGNVYASANGSLEELAATVAIVSERTARSGAEIGNAFKLIQSRLTAPEVYAQIVKKTGIELETAGEKTKSFTQFLLELDTASAKLTKTERDRLLVVIGGARRINILRNSLDGVTDSVIAASRALRDNGSATDEMVENSRTLEAAMDRLRGTLVEIVNDSGEGIGALITDVVNTTNLLLKLANAFDGLAIKIGIATAVFLGLRVALIQLNIASIVSAARMTVLSGGMYAAGTAGFYLATAVTAVRTAINPLNGIIAALTVGITLATSALGSYAEAQAEAAIRAQELAGAAQRQAIENDRTLKADKSLLNALRERLKLLAELRKQQQEGKDVTDQLVKVNKDIENLQVEAGITVDTDNIKQAQEEIKQREKEIGEERIKNAERAKSALEAEIRQQEKLVKAKQAEIKALIERNRQYYLFPEIALADQIRDQEKAIDDSLKKLAELRTALSSLDEAFKLDQAIIDSTPGLRDVVNRLTEVSAKFKQLQSFKQIDNDLGGKTPRQKILAALEREKELRKLLADSEEDLLKAEEKGLQSAEKLRKERAAMNKELAEARKLQIQLASESYQNSYKRRLDDQADFAQAIARNNAELARLRNKNINGGQLDSSIQDQITNINILREEADRLAREGKRGTLVPVSKEEVTGRANALAEKQVEVLNQAAEAQKKLTESILATEIDILKTKQQATEEIRKQLGLLSDEEKLAVLAQAQEFKKNPNQKISAQDLFFGSSQFSSLITRFFADRIDLNKDAGPNDIFKNIFNPAGLSNDAIANANRRQEALDKFFRDQGGRDKALEESYKATRRLADNVDKLLGRLPLTTKEATPAEIISPPINVNIPNNFVDFQPVFDQFNNIIFTQIEKVRAEFVKELQDFKDEYVEERTGLPDTQ